MIVHLRHEGRSRAGLCGVKQRGVRAALWCRHWDYVPEPLSEVATVVRSEAGLRVFCPQCLHRVAEDRRVSAERASAPRPRRESCSPWIDRPRDQDELGDS